MYKDSPEGRQTGLFIMSDSLCFQEIFNILCMRLQVRHYLLNSRTVLLIPINSLKNITNFDLKTLLLPLDGEDKFTYSFTFEKQVRFQLNYIWKE
jgi:hypothetical protein